MARCVSRPCEARMCLFHQAIATDKERCRPAVQVNALRNLFGKLIGGPRSQHRISNAVVGDERLEAAGVRLRITPARSPGSQSPVPLEWNFL